MAKKDCDVLILGAGAAGLAAAGQLAATGLKVLVIEARDRIGGRIHTHREYGMSFPIELGAEFVHGEPEETLELFGASQMSVYESNDRRERKVGGKIVDTAHFWDKLGDVFGKMSPDRKVDRSFAEFLSSRAKTIEPLIAKQALEFVEGFQGAPADQISERALTEDDDSSSGDGPKTYRLFDGYDSVIHRLKTRLPSPDQTLRLNRVATELRLNKESVECDVVHRVTKSRETYRATCAIVTLPIGVLKSALGQEGTLRITPMPAGLASALEGVEMGTASRVMLRFRSYFWEKALGHTMGFVMTGETDSTFPVWWSAAPVRVPMLTGWAGGPAAQRHSALTQEQLVMGALEDLAKLFDLKRADLERELISAHHHDWLNDVYSRGAYSFVRVGGTRAAKRLEKKFGTNLFIAGEGTCSGSPRGTVAGAVESGLRSALQVASLISVAKR